MPLKTRLAVFPKNSTFTSVIRKAVSFDYALENSECREPGKLEADYPFISDSESQAKLLKRFGPEILLLAGTQLTTGVHVSEDVAASLYSSLAAGDYSLLLKLAIYQVISDWVASKIAAYGGTDINKAILDRARASSPSDTVSFIQGANNFIYAEPEAVLEL